MQGNKRDEDNIMTKLQAEGDKALIGRCIGGLGLYVAQTSTEHSLSPKYDEISTLVKKLVRYHELDHGEHTPLMDNFLEAFEGLIYEVRTGGEIPRNLRQHQVEAILGLQLHGEVMVTNSGVSAMNDILDVGDLMREMASYWDFEPLAVDQLADQLSAKVHEMLKDIILPGQSIRGDNVNGYSVVRDILFDNGRGFALARNPVAPASFVTWQFTEEAGKRDYYWGHYTNRQDRALIDYIDRVWDYMKSNMVTEKLAIAAAEVSAESKSELATVADSSGNIAEAAQDIAVHANDTQNPKVAPLEIFIQHDYEFETGSDIGEWLKLPTTPEALGHLFTRIGVPDPYDEFYTVAKVHSPNCEIWNVITSNDSIDELNMLAFYLSNMEDWELSKLRAALKLDIVTGGDGAEALINLLDADNFDKFSLIAAANEEELGRYWEEEDPLSFPEDISHEEYGRQTAMVEKGKFTEWGYVYFRNNSLSQEYGGIVPQKYRIVDMALLDAAKNNEATKRAAICGHATKQSVMNQIKAARQIPEVPSDQKQVKKPQGRGL